jgi:hypothetical protein
MKSAISSLFSLLFASLCPLAAAEPELNVEVIPPPSGASPAPLLVVRVRFYNPNVNAVVRVIRPLADSILGLSAPIDRLTLRDQTGALAKSQPICGNALSALQLPKGTKWPEDFIVTLSGGESFETPLIVPFVMPKEGPSTLSFEYVMPAKPVSRMGLKYPENVWHGTARAKDVTLQPGILK